QSRKSKHHHLDTPLAHRPRQYSHLTQGAVWSSHQNRRRSEHKQKPRASVVGNENQRLCDGDRPSCKMCLERGSKCEYSVEEGKTQQQATKEQLRSYKDVLSLLRNSSPKESEAILHILKNMDLNDACRFVLDGPVFVPNP
ncbi:hypothetical protein E4T50_15844, partial [Aureobasidium sp. EXF-12298]